MFGIILLLACSHVRARTRFLSFSLSFCLYFFFSFSLLPSLWIHVLRLSERVHTLACVCVCVLLNRTGNPSLTRNSTKSFVICPLSLR